MGKNIVVDGGLVKLCEQDLINIANYFHNSDDCRYHLLGDKIKSLILFCGSSGCSGVLSVCKAEEDK